MLTVRPDGDDTIDGSTSPVTMMPGHCYGYVVESEGKWLELWRPSSPKIRLTAEGGIAVLWTNGTGAVTIKGTVVDLDSSNDTFEVCPANDIDAVGIVYESGIAAGSEAWVVILGVAEGLLEDSTAGTAGYWCGISTTQAGRFTANAISPANQTRHFQEMGHCLQNVAAGTDQLCRLVLHWN
jgi:hypothetical protein